MNIEQLDDKTIKLVLSKQDMDNFGITYDELDYNNESTKDIITLILNNVKEKTKLDFSNGKLFIEAFPYADGGCVLYINILKQSADDSSKKAVKKSFDTPVIYVFDNVKSLYQLCVELNKRFSHIVLKSTLCCYKGSYYMLIYTYFKMEDELSRLLLEYSFYFGKGAVLAAMIKEHGKVLFEENAAGEVEKLLT